MVLKYLLMLMFIFVLFVPLANADATAPVNEPTTTPQNLSVALHYQTPIPLMSDRLYSNWAAMTLSCNYEKESGLWPFTKNEKFVKSLLLEVRLSRIWGKDIVLGQDQVSEDDWERARQEGHDPTVDWDHYLIGVMPSYRFYYPMTPAVRGYVEAGIGITVLNKPLIEEGTLWNFLLSGGMGLDFRVKIPFFAFIKFEHISNGGNTWNSLTSNPVRVIGPEGLVFGLGTRFSL